MESIRKKSWATRIYGHPYLNTVKSRFWKVLLVVFGAAITYTVFREHFDKVIVEGILVDVPHGVKASLVAIVALGYVLIQLCKRVSKMLLPTSSSLLMAVLVSIWYWVFIRKDTAYHYYTLQFPFLQWLYFTDIVYLYVLYWCFDFRTYRKKLALNEEGSFEVDTPLELDIKQLLATPSTLNTLALTIEQTSSKGSFSIGVFAKWGQGKSTFLKGLLTILKQNEKTNIIVEFNPWKAVATEKMLEDFFETLAKALKPYNSAVATDIRRYGQKIFSKSKELPFHIGEVVMDEIIPEATLKDKYDAINESISATGKRVIVLIDDMDRMTGNEIIQVFRIIRNTANFDNVFYITALDHDYVVRALESAKSFSFEADYLKKIFQLIVSLPVIPANSFLRQLEIGLLDIAQLPEDREDIRKALSFIAPQQDGLFQDNGTTVADYLLDNYRDVKRVVNSFKISYPLIKGEVEASDLLLLELIKNKNYSAYQAILSKKLLSVSENEDTCWSLNKDYLKEMIKDLKIDIKDAKHLENTLKQVIDFEQNKTGRQFSKRINFKTYMAYQLFDQISRRAFNDAMTLPPAERRKQFDLWIKQGYKDSLDSILDQETEFDSSDQWMDLIKTYLINGELELEFNLRAQDLIRRRGEYLHLFNNERRELDKAITEMLQDVGTGLQNRAQLAAKLLEEHDTKNDHPVATPDLLRKIIYWLFDLQLNSQIEYDDFLIDFYLLNRDQKSSTNRVYQTNQANQRMLEYLTQDTSRMRGYLNTIIRSYSQPNFGNEFALAPFTPDIFGDWNKFEVQLNRLDIEEEHLNRIKEITLRGVQEYKKGRRNFQVSEEECEWLIDHLIKNKQYPETLRNVVRK